jgi:hypothetical protein
VTNLSELEQAILLLDEERANNRLLIQGIRDLFRNTYPGNGLSTKVPNGEGSTEAALTAMKGYIANENAWRTRVGEDQARLRDLEADLSAFRRVLGFETIINSVSLVSQGVVINSPTDGRYDPS